MNAKTVIFGIVGSASLTFGCYISRLDVTRHWNTPSEAAISVFFALVFSLLPGMALILIFSAILGYLIDRLPKNNIEESEHDGLSIIDKYMPVTSILCVATGIILLLIHFDVLGMRHS